MYKLIGNSLHWEFPVLAVLQENHGETLTLGIFKDKPSAQTWLDEVEDDFRLGQVLQLLTDGDSEGASAALDAIMRDHPDHYDNRRAFRH